MRLLREWSHRIAGTLLRRRRDEDLEEELRSHLELTADEAQRRGQAPHEALRTAQLRSGVRCKRSRRCATSAVCRGSRRCSVMCGMGAHATPQSIFYARCARHTGPRHRRERGDLSAARRDPPPHAAGEGAGSTRHRGTGGHDAMEWPSIDDVSGADQSAVGYFRDHQAVFSSVAAWANADSDSNGAAAAGLRRVCSSAATSSRCLESTLTSVVC